MTAPDPDAVAREINRAGRLGHLSPPQIQEIADAIRAAVLAEREACARLAGEYENGTETIRSLGTDIADAIRARGQP